MALEITDICKFVCAGMCGDWGCEDCLILAFFTVFIPPIAVLWETGCSTDLFINIILTILGIIPGKIHSADFRPPFIPISGIIHAFYIVCKY